MRQQMNIIYTDTEKCKGCYACVRVCPSKAIKVENSRAEIMPELCINCGTCLRVCAPGAKQIESDIDVVKNLMDGKNRVIAIPSSSFPAALPEYRPGQFVSALKKVGFTEVMEDAFGGEMVSRAYKELLKNHEEGPIFSSTCPAIVWYIEKFYPQLVKYLAPIVSPMIAMGRLIKTEDPEAKVVFVGPCAAKKAESKEESAEGVIDGVLTFHEIKEMFSEKGVIPENEPDEKFSGPKPNLGRYFAISGGLLRTAGFTEDITYNGIINAHGRDYVIGLLSEIAQGKIDARFINFFFCHGCIDGPGIDNDLSIFRRRELISRYAQTDADPEQTERDLQKYSNIDLRRSFTMEPVSLPEVKGEEIKSIMAQMGKTNRSNIFNCGACGYKTCLDLATAVARGQAEITMCWPHLLQELRETQEDLIQAEKLSSLGQLAASIAHEINNPLAGVLVYTELLDKKINNDSYDRDKALNYLGKMKSELTRSTKLVRNLLDFARQSPPSLRETDINEIIKRSQDLVFSTTSIENIETVKQIENDLPQIMADPDQLQQVSMNLILNAIQSMPEGGTLTIRTIKDNGFVRFEIEDTGYGIPAENMNKLFTPFFTTKKEVKGVGLGLAVSYGIIQRHHGKITVKSKEGEGTTFSVQLPVKNAEKN
jgi:two-component system, NtrC family, sensor kinase